MFCSMLHTLYIGGIYTAVPDCCMLYDTSIICMISHVHTAVAQGRKQAQAQLTGRSVVHQGYPPPLTMIARGPTSERATQQLGRKKFLCFIFTYMYVILLYRAYNLWEKLKISENIYRQTYVPTCWRWNRVLCVLSLCVFVCVLHPVWPTTLLHTAAVLYSCSILNASSYCRCNIPPHYTWCIFSFDMYCGCITRGRKLSGADF